MTDWLNDVDWETYRSVVPIGQEPERDTGPWLARENLILQYYYLAKRIVAKMAKTMPNHVDRDDLESLAVLGLMKAVTQYNHTLGVPFEAYATQKMRSSIMDGIRHQDWAPRTLRRKQRDIEKAEAVFRQENGRVPTYDEVAAILDIDAAEVGFTKHQSEIATHAYIESSAEAMNKTNEVVDDLDLITTLRTTAARTLRNMPVREATVIALHYYANKKLHEVAEIMGISGVKVGQLHKEAILSLCQALEAVLDET